MEPLREGCAGAAACAGTTAGRGSCEAALLVRRPKKEGRPLEGRRGFWRGAGSCTQRGTPVDHATGLRAPHSGHWQGQRPAAQRGKRPDWGVLAAPRVQDKITLWPKLEAEASLCWQPAEHPRTHICVRSVLWQPCWSGQTALWHADFNVVGKAFVVGERLLAGCAAALQLIAICQQHAAGMMPCSRCTCVPLGQGEACLLQICHSLVVRCGVRHAGQLGLRHPR